MTELNDDQLRFVRLHQRYFVKSWQILFQGGMVRAKAEHVSATISTYDLEPIVEAGLMVAKYGNAMELTTQGKAVS